MKRIYGAPDIVFESFALCENIATVNSNCQRNVTTAFSGTCGIPFGDLPEPVFTITASGCKYKATDGSPYYDNLCYHVPTADNKLFNS